MPSLILRVSSSIIHAYTMPTANFTAGYENKTNITQDFPVNYQIQASNLNTIARKANT